MEEIGHIIEKWQEKNPSDACFSDCFIVLDDECFAAMLNDDIADLTDLAKARRATLVVFSRSNKISFKELRAYVYQLHEEERITKKRR